MSLRWTNDSRGVVGANGFDRQALTCVPLAIPAPSSGSVTEIWVPRQSFDPTGAIDSMALKRAGPSTRRTSASLETFTPPATHRDVHPSVGLVPTHTTVAGTQGAVGSAG